MYMYISLSLRGISKNCMLLLKYVTCCECVSEPTVNGRQVGVDIPVIAGDGAHIHSLVTKFNLGKQESGGISNNHGTTGARELGPFICG